MCFSNISGKFILCYRKTILKKTHNKSLDKIRWKQFKIHSILSLFFTSLEYFSKFTLEVLYCFYLPKAHIKLNIKYQNIFPIP